MIHADTKKIPRIRFPEFSGEWQRKKLHDVLLESKERNSKGKFNKNDVLSVSGEYGIVNQIKFKGRSFAGVSVLSYHIVETNDIVYTKSPLKDNPYGIIKYNSGSAGIVSTLYAVYKPQQDTNPKFIDYYFRLHDNVNNYLRPLVHKGAKNDMKISNDHVLDGYVYITSFKEQQKIADFLTVVDERIEGLSKKIELLKKYKKGVMQKIFSHEISFKDENEKSYPEWKEKILGEIMVESRIKGSKGDKANKLTIKLWGKGVFRKIDNTIGSANTQYYKRKAGQFIYSKLDFLNCAFGIIPKELDGLESTIDLPAFDVNEKYDPKFLLERIKQKDFYKKFGETADGSRKARRIHADVFLGFTLLVPTSLKEQQKISDFLTAIEEKIQFEERKLTESKKFKKSLLQQMFV